MGLMLMASCQYILTYIHVGVHWCSLASLDLATRQVSGNLLRLVAAIHSLDWYGLSSLCLHSNGSQDLWGCADRMGLVSPVSCHSINRHLTLTKYTL